MVYKRGAKLCFSGNFVSNCGKGAPNCDAQWLTTKKGRQFFERLKKNFRVPSIYLAPGADTPFRPKKTELQICPGLLILYRT